MRAEQVRILFEHLPSALIATAAVGALVASVLRDHVPSSWLIPWLIALYATSLVRVFFRRAYLRAAPDPIKSVRWAHRFLFGVAISGVIWGVVGIFPIPSEDFIEQMFVAFVLAGLAAGGMSTLSSYRGAYALFLVPAILPFAFKTMLLGGDIFLAMSAMLILFIAMMSLISARYYRSVSESLRLRYGNVELQHDLAAARTQQHAIGRELEAEAQERRRTEVALQTSNQFYRTLVETTGTGYHVTDAQGRIVDANAAYVQLTGHRTLDEIRGRAIGEWTAPYDVLRSARELQACLSNSGGLHNFEIDYMDTRRRVTPVEINATAVWTDGAMRLLCLSRDITRRKHSERTLRLAHDDLELTVQERTTQLAHANEVLYTEKELFRITLASIGDAVITTDAKAHIAYLNAVAERVTGWLTEEVRGKPLTAVLSILDEVTRAPLDDIVPRCLKRRDGAGNTERCLLVCRDEREINIDMSAAPIRDSGAGSVGVVLVFRDVTQERKLAQELSYQATHDPLTGLCNRREFERRLSALLETASTRVSHVLLYLDLDQFKVVNDSCGHAAGDDLLRQISALLRTKMRSRDTLARLGGDEFGVLLEDCSVREAEALANALRELLQSFRFRWGYKTFTIGVSIGLVPIAQSGETLTAVFSAADQSCYAAKERGRNRVHVYQPDDSALTQRDGEMRWMPRIQEALVDGRFRLYYQPIVSVGRQGEPLVHGEILIRMVDESGRIVLPGAFLPAAERYGLMPSLDRWVVERTLDQVAAVQTAGTETIFALNISGQSLGEADFLDFVVDCIETSRVTPGNLCFEITETSALSELTHALRFIDSLKARGCKFSLDDFGTGLSSFSYLKNLPLDFLKIDGSFVRGVGADAIDEAMVDAVHRIGHIMGLRTIAESVESEAVLAQLKTIGVDYGQGFALASPEPLRRAA